MKRTAARLTGYTLGYLFVVLLDRIVRRVEEERELGGQLLTLAEAEALGFRQLTPARSCWCSQHQGMTRRAGLACEGAA